MYTKFIMLEIKSGFTCSQLNMHGNTVICSSMSLNFFVCQIKTSWRRLYISCVIHGAVLGCQIQTKTQAFISEATFLFCACQNTNIMECNKRVLTVH